MFARAVNEDPIIQAALETAILHKVDCEKGEGIEVAQRFEVGGYPTFKMVGPDGAVSEAWIGYDGPEAWSGQVAAGVADRRTLVAKAEAYQAQPTAALARSLGNAAAANYDWKGAVGYFDAAAGLDPAHAGEFQDNAFTFTYYGTYGQEPAFGLDEVAAAADKAFNREGQTVASQVEIASMVTSAARQADRPEVAIPYLEKAMAASAGSTDEAVLSTRARIAVDHALLVLKDKAAALDLKRASQPEGWQDDPRRLNGFAWWCLENEVNLAEAQALALKAVDLATSDRQRAQILDTVAELCHAQGDCDDATAHLRRALELDPGNEEFQQKLAKFDCGKDAAKG